MSDQPRKPLAASLADSIRGQLETGDPWKRAIISVAVVFGGLYLLDAFGSPLALPVAALVFVGVLIIQ